MIFTVSTQAETDGLSDFLWVPCYESNNVYKIDIRTHEVAAIIPVGLGPAGIAVGFDHVYVTCRHSSHLYCISKAEDIVTDSINLGPQLAFGIAVALDVSNRIYVAGRVSTYAYEMNQARLLKLDRDGTLLAERSLVQVQGDNWYPEWNQMSVIGIAIEEPEIMLPWQRSWDVHTGIIITDTAFAELTNYSFDPHTRGYRGPGAAYDRDGRGWSSGDREGANYLIGHRLPGYWGYYRLGPWFSSGQIYGDVAVDDSGYVWTGSALGILMRFDPVSHQTTIFEIGSQIKGIAIDKYGYIWVALTPMNTMVKFNSEGIQVGSPVHVGQVPLGFGDMTGHEFSRRMTAVDDEETLPERLSSLAAYPNPFNTSTRISYILPEPGRVKLVIYNLLGQSVATLVGDNQTAGRHEIVWDADDLTSGVYIAAMETADGADILKIAIVK